MQGDAVLLPGSGGPQLTSPSSLAATGGMHQVPEELQKNEKAEQLT